MSEGATVGPSFLRWVLDSLGLAYAIVLPLSGLVCFLLALTLVRRGKGPMAAAGLILIVNIPLLMGIFAALEKGIASYMMIAMSQTQPQPAAVTAGIATALCAPLVGLLVMVPAYAVATMGTFTRALAARTESEYS